MTARPIVALAERIYVDKRLVTKKKIKNRYRVELYDENACGKCSNMPDRPNDLCEQCPAFGGLYNLHREFKSEYGQDYWSLPVGDIQYVRDHLLPADKDGIDVRKGYIKRPFKYPLRWIGKLYTSDDKDDNGNPRPNQVELVDKWMVNKNGLIRARPRSGKTVVAVNISCRLGMKTVIVADRIELLKQFRWTYVGKRDKPPMTNARELEREHGIGRVVKIIRGKADIDRLPDIALVTIQSLFDNPYLLQKLNANYSFLAADEIHGFSADASSRALALLSMMYRLGLSATIERKDSREVLTDRTMGPVVATSKTHSLVPRIKAIMVESSPPSDYKSWNNCLKWAANDRDRNVQIIKQIFRDLKDGHKCIIVPVFWKDHQAALVDAINTQVRRLRKLKKAKYPLDLAVPFHSGVNRQRTLDRADNGEPCVLIAINSMIKQGVDLRMPTMLHLVIPASAGDGVGAPMFRQLSYRTSTPMPGKREPEVTLWVDPNLSMFKGALNGLFWKEIVPGLKKGNFLYRISDHDFKTMSSLKTNKRVRSGSSWV